MGFRVPVLEKFSWQEPIQSIITVLPDSPVKGDRYLVSFETAELDAALTGKENNFVWYDGVEWKFDVPQRGWMVVDLSTDQQLQFLWSAANSANMWKVTGGGASNDLILKGDVDSAESAITWTLKDNDPHALDFVTAGEEGEDPITLLNISTVDDNEAINVNSNVNINGDLHVQGELTYVNTTTLQVNDALVELNQGGDEVTATTDGAGFVVTKLVQATEAVGEPGDPDYVAAVAEHTDVIGYVKTTVTSTDAEPTLHVKPVGSDYEFNIRMGNTIDHNVNIFLKQNEQNQKDPLGNSLNNLILDQSLSTIDEVKFAQLEITGESDLFGRVKVGAFTGSGTAADPYAPVVGSESDVLISGGLKTFDDAEFKNDVKVDGTFVASQDAVVGFNLTVGQNALVQGDAQIYGQLKDASGTKAITVPEIKTAYDSRALYDEDLGCIVFDVDKLDHIKSEKHPRVVSTAPGKNATNVANTDPITLQLDTAQSIDLADATKVHLATVDGTPVTATVVIDNDETSAGSGVYTNTVTITPSADLDYNATYIVSIEEGAFAYTEDIENVNTEDDNVVTFTTAQELGPLTILRSVPANGSTNFDPAGTITIEYNYPIQAGTGNIEFREIV